MARHPSPPSSSSSSAGFIEAALKTTGPLSLSYIHHRLKWMIRNHLLSLVEEFPSLKPSSGHFTHDDGTTVHLLNAKGALSLSPPLPPAAAVHLTIWLYQGYPFVPPIVYLSSAEIDRSHPFVDSSGAAATPYLHNWQFPHSNLCDLVRNLVHVFTLCPPSLALTCVQTSQPTPPPPRVVGGSLASRREAMDRLYASLDCDVATFRSQVEEDVRSLMSIQSELRERVPAIDCTLGELQREKESLRRAVAEVERRADVLRNWLWANNSIPPAPGEGGPEEVFELLADQGWSRCVVDNEAACRAIDDVVWALDGALGEGAVPLDAYLKQVRALSREQFFHIAKLQKLQKN